MRLTKLVTRTSKMVPSEEESKNAQLLIRAGYVHKEMSGVYSYLPLGKIVLDNIANIVREEINKTGAFEVQMSSLQSRELWEKTGRWDDKLVDNWFKTKLANGQELGLGLTHEEPVINSLLPFVSSYKDLPFAVYQVQTKFRNEIRAKSGLMRSRELLMKDQYSFSKSEDDHKKYYEEMADVYLKIYSRFGVGDITYRTYADGGIFSEFSDEFQTLSEVGEDTIYVDEEKRIAINKEVYKDDVLKKLGLDKSKLVERKAVEVGNIFSLGTKYTKELGLDYIDENGKKQDIVMGCYGIGVSRMMGLLAEHFSDEKGLSWPKEVAPAIVYLINIGNDSEVVKAADEAYDELSTKGFKVIYDDRDLRPGEKFADADLLGIPYRVVVSEKNLAEKKYELKARNEDSLHILSMQELLKYIA
ncbi:MAG: aminoacyl--tRNA ligase-related protein [bacterium]